MKQLTLRNVLNVLKYLLIYYLSAKMICFAIPKLLHMQFRVLHYESYLPLAEISKYQHMWSFFGRSYNYNIFIGLAEFLIGALVVFKRTRLIALLISLGVCANIIILNIEFEIFFALEHVLVDFAITLILLSLHLHDQILLSFPLVQLPLFLQIVFVRFCGYPLLEMQSLSTEF